MFTVYLSKAFIENIFDEKNSTSELFDLFKNDFFTKLNISKLICDFDINEYSNPNIKRVLRILMNDGVPFESLLIKQSLEKFLVDSHGSDEGLGYRVFRKLFLIHLPLKTIDVYKHLKDISVVSSFDFEESFKSFLINGALSNETTQADYFNCKSDFNPFNCPGCKTVLIDEAYFLTKRADKIINGVIKQDYYINQVNEFVDTFIEPLKATNKAIVIMVPTYDDVDRKLSWTKKEQEVIRSLTVTAVLNKIPTCHCYVYFHPLRTHSRKVLSDKHFYKMEMGFDFIKINREDKRRLEETVDSIDFKSVYVKNKTLSEYFRIRIVQANSKAAKYFN